MQGGRREEAGQPAARAVARAPPSSGGGSGGAANGRGAGGLQPLQEKLQQHIDREDRRIKELTEAILYDFLPHALRAVAGGGGDYARELTPKKCRAVAGAALAVAALMNAPPGFLEFLLCVPWAALGRMYPWPFDSSSQQGGGKGGGAGSGAAFFDWTARPGATQDDGGGGPGLPSTGAPGSPSAGAAGGRLPLPQLEASKEERAALVNLPLSDPALMECVLDFLLREEHAESLPPMMRVPHGDPLTEAQQPFDPTCPTRDTVAALLDGATTLHCAAIRGNPAQVDHLLLCGADPLAINAAGEMPVENVPVCGDRCIAGALSCRCMGARDQEAWECRSRLARTLILRRCAVSWGRHGFGAWLRVVALCLLCLLGLWGHHTSLRRPALEAQVAQRRQRRRQAALQRAQAMLLKLRTNVSSGRELLAQPGGGEGEGGGQGPPDPGERAQAGGKENDRGGGGGGAGGQVPHAAHAAPLLKELREEGGSYRLVEPGGAGACRSTPGAFDRAERAYGCFTAAVDLLQTLDLGGGVTPRGVAEVGGADSPAFLVGEEEQAAIYSGWAKAALLKFRACGCTGCASLALHTAMAAHRQLASLFAKLERRRKAGGGSKGSRGAGQAAGGGKPRLRPSSRQSAAAAAATSPSSRGGSGRNGKGASAGEAAWGGGEGGESASSGAEDGDAWQRVGGHLAAALHACMCVLLGTDVRQSATRAGVWRAQQCLQEWGRLQLLGLTEECGGEECLEAECLEGWCRAAAADLVLAEALRGAPMAPRQLLAEVLPLVVQYDMQTGAPSLNRPVSREVVGQLSEALALARPYASAHVLRVADAVARQMQDEITAGERLRELLAPRGAAGGGAGGGASGAAMVEQLSEAIAAAERFSNLQSEVEQAQGLRERWIRRAEAQAQLDAVIDEVAAPASEGLLSRPPGGGAPVVDAEAFWAELNARLARLETAAEAARQANIGVSRAKRVLKELAGQGAAVEAAAKLDEALAEGKAGSGAIKSALAKAETAVAGASGGAGSACAFQLGLELLNPRIHAARQKLEVERAAEGLVRAVAGCRTVGDLPRLEAAILAARKLGAQGLHPDTYKAASDLRTRLEAASRARSTLDAALRGLLKSGRQEDVDAVERAVEEAGGCSDLLQAECQRAREAVHRWRSATASEAKLTRALREGVGTQQLSRVIKEAAASGVKVGEARRLLKVMQGLEAAVQAAVEGPFQYQALKAKIEAAEAGGAPPQLLASARATMQRLLVREVRTELDAVLKAERNRTDKSITQRLSALKAVLDKADTVLSMEEELAEQFGSAGGVLGTVAAQQGSPRAQRSSSAASRSHSASAQGTADVWEDATAASVVSGGVPEAAAATAPAAPALGAVAQEEGDAGAATAPAAAAAVPESPSRALSRTDTGESAASTASEGTAAQLEARASAEAEADTEPFLSATASACEDASAAAAGGLSVEPSGVGGEDQEASSTSPRQPATEVEGEEVAGAEDSAAAAAPQQPQLSVVVPARDPQVYSAASTPSAAYSTPADSPSGEEPLSPEAGEAAMEGEGQAKSGDELAEEPSGAAEAEPELAEADSVSGEEGEPGPGEDDLTAVMRLVRRARRQLAREEAEQARIERERAEEARLRREAQAQLKAERERADKERAEKARAERAERRAAQEAAKAERRERERQRQLERERERAAREKAAREHFAALQRQRRAAQLASPQQAPKASPMAVGLAGAPLASPRTGLAPLQLQQQQPHLPLQLPQQHQQLHPPTLLPPHVAGLLSAVQEAQHARADSLESLSVATGLLELLNESESAGQEPLLGTGGLGAAPTRHLHSSESSMLSPSSTGTAGDAWEASLGAAAAEGGGAGLQGMAAGTGAGWHSGDTTAGMLGSSVAGSEQGLGASLLSPDWSPARLGAGSSASGTAGAPRIRFSDLGGASWLAEGGAGPASSSGLDTSSAATAIPASSALAGAPGRLAGSGGSLGLSSTAGLWDAGPGTASALDDLALLGHRREGGGSIWQGGGGDSWGGGGAGGLGLAGLESPGAGGAGLSGMLSPPRHAAAAAAAAAAQQLAQQAAAQQRQAQLLAAIDAAKAQVQLNQQAAAAAAAAATTQLPGGQRVCKYFLQGFCREGTKCRYAHSTGGGAGGLGAAALGPLVPRLGADIMAAAAASGFQGGAGGGGGGLHLQPPSLPALSMPMVVGSGVGEGSRAVSSFAFGAPGAQAFSSGGSAPASRPATPDVRQGVGPATSAPLSAALALAVAAAAAGAASQPAATGSSMGGPNTAPFSPSRPLAPLYTPRAELPPVPAAEEGGGSSDEEMGSADSGTDHYGLPSEASLFSDLLPEVE